MAKAIFKALLTFIANIVSVFLLPVNLLIDNAFPDFSTQITTFTTYLGRIVGRCADALNYFLYILPTSWVALIMIYLEVLIAIYTITISIHLILKVIDIIKRIKVW